MARLPFQHRANTELSGRSRASSLCRRVPKKNTRLPRQDCTPATKWTSPRPDLARLGRSQKFKRNNPRANSSLRLRPYSGAHDWQPISAKRFGGVGGGFVTPRRPAGKGTSLGMALKNTRGLQKRQLPSARHGGLRTGCVWFWWFFKTGFGSETVGQEFALF